MSSTKVTDPNSKSNSGFLWAIVALLVIAAIVVGFIVFRGQNATVEQYADYETTPVSAESEYSGNSITLTAAEPAADAEEVSLYEDYSCSYCADLAENTDAQMLEEIQNGNLVVNLHPLNFLDQDSVGHSTQALAATLALASRGETEAYWNLREVLFAEQQDIYNQWDADDFADAAQGLGASEEAVNAIRNEEHVEEATRVAEANAQTLEEQTGSVSSPRILQNGEDLPIEDTNQWIDYVLS